MTPIVICLMFLLAFVWVLSGVFVLAMTSGYVTKKYRPYKYLGIIFGWPLWTAYIINKK